MRSGCAQSRKVLFRVHLFRTNHQDLFAFNLVGVGNAAIHRTYRCALFLIEMSDALSALFWDDIVKVV